MYNTTDCISTDAQVKSHAIGTDSYCIFPELPMWLGCVSLCDHDTINVYQIS